MNIRLRNILAVIGGIVIGSIANMALISLGSKLIPAPAGVDVTSMEGLKANMHLFEFKNFIFPFLGHAVGTLLGAYFTAKMAGSFPLIFAMIIGLVFLAGGITSIFMLPSPLWFTLSDVILAYLPMAYLGAKMAYKKPLYP